MEYKQRTGHSFGGKSGPRFPSSASLILTDIWTTSTLPRTVPGKCNQTNQRFCSSFPTLSFLRWMGNPRQSLLEPFYVYYYFFLNQQVDRVQRLRQIPRLSIRVPPLISLGPAQAPEGSDTRRSNTVDFIRLQRGTFQEKLNIIQGFLFPSAFHDNWLARFSILQTP